MKLEQIRIAAESEAFYLSDRSWTKIFVQSTAGDERADGICSTFQAAIDSIGLRVKIIRAGSSGCYHLEPIVVIEKSDLPAILYHNVTPDSVSDLIHGSLLKNERGKVGVLCSAGGEKVDGIPHISELPLFSLQRRVALRNCGWIDPEDINHYLLRGQGYTALSRALKREPRELLEFRIDQALKGRCWGGDSTADKWRLVRNSKEADKCLICRAIDVDPDACTAQLLLESDPHSVLEGILIGAYAVGAPHCLIFVRENTHSARILRKALEQATSWGLSGANILGSGFGAEIEIEEVSAGCGSGCESGLFHCVDEAKPLQHFHPNYPAVSRFLGKQLIVSRPEALANLSAWAHWDSDEARGSKVVTLTGNVANKCTVEAAFGTPARELAVRPGGGTSSGKPIKTLKIGGPAGRFILPDSDDVRIGGEADAASIYGLSPDTIRVFDADASILTAVRDIMSFIQAQSCGRCVFCREGCLQMLTILEDLCENRGDPRDVDLLTELGRDLKTACLCAFGRSAPDAVLSSIDLFRAEFVERIKRSHFPGHGSPL